MAIATELPIRLKTVADYRQMDYDHLLACINELNVIERFIPHDLYTQHKAVVGSLMMNIQRRACMDAYAAQIAAAERHIAELERALA